MSRASELSAGKAVDWRFASTVGARLARPGPPATDYTRRQAIADLTECARAAEGPVRDVTGLFGDGPVAEARIVEDRISDPIMPGDKVYTPVWGPGEQRRFALTGFLDVDGDEARFCLESWPPWLCHLKRPYFHRIDLETDPAEWVARRIDAPSAARRSALVSLFLQVMRASERTDAVRDERIAANERALASIVRTYGSERVFVVHLPMRSEVVRGSYDTYARNLPDLVGDMGVDYFSALSECAWSPPMFFEHDTHPNARGYRQVASCVGDYLRGRVMRSSGSFSLRPAKREG